MSVNIPGPAKNKRLAPNIINSATLTTIKLCVIYEQLYLNLLFSQKQKDGGGILAISFLKINK